ncbi:hypothetical protein BKA70DRAFT_1111921, partial [Coprinopsis sp. MPI-PUGE-AT-0042]
ELLQQILDFLSLVNFRSIQQENLGKQTPNTLKWLLEGSMFQWWLATHCAILWGTGMPGAGKTILASSAVIQYLEHLAHASSDICVAYVYCRYTEPMKVRDILAALVRQLLERFPHLLPIFKPIYTHHKLRMTKPTQAELIDVIRTIINCFRIAYLFIDGLDEALYDEQFNLLDTLTTVKANFFITSRPLVRLKDVLPKVEFFDIAAREEDIKLLISQHLCRNPDFHQILATDEQRERVNKKICESSHGMFLHASLMVEAVSHCIGPRHAMEQLDKLPAGLDALYEVSFKRINMQPEERAALATRILLWVVYAFEPLTVDDLRYAVARDPKVDWETPEELVTESLLVSVCCGLVTAEGDHPYRIVRLVRKYYTALDALKRILAKRETSAHCRIAELCLERLIECGIPAGQASYYLGYGWHMRPLLNYAYNSWHLHAKESIPCPAVAEARPIGTMLRFLAVCQAYPAWISDHNHGYQSPIDHFTTPIHLIVWYHLPALLTLIDPLVNEQTKGGKSALILAALHNDADMAVLLLKLDGIDVNLQDNEGNTALILSAGMGLPGVVKALLFDPRIDINKRNKRGQTALHRALDGVSSSGHTKAALHLIATPGIDFNAADNRGCTPLSLVRKHRLGPLGLLNNLTQYPDIGVPKVNA